MDFFGLDIGTHALKIAQVEKRGKKSRLLAFGSSPAPNRGLLSEAEADLTKLAKAIRKLRDEAKIKTKNVATALPEDQVFTKIVTFPKLSEKELQAAIQWEAEQYVPIPLNDVVLDYQIVRKFKEKEAEKMEVFLVAAPKRLVAKVLKTLRAADLTPISLETEILALARSMTTAETDTCLLMDLGARATDLAIVDQGQVVFTRSVATAGEAFTRAVASGLNLESGQAEEYKQAYGVDPAKLEGKISKVLETVFQNVVQEMEKIMKYHQDSRSQTVKRVILAGGSAGLPGLVPFLAQRMNLEIQVADPFVNLEVDEEVLKKLPSGSPPFYATAIGLALKKV